MKEKIDKKPITVQNKPFSPAFQTKKANDINGMLEPTIIVIGVTSIVSPHFQL